MDTRQLRRGGVALCVALALWLIAATSGDTPAALLEALNMCAIVAALVGLAFLVSGLASNRAG